MIVRLNGRLLDDPDEAECIHGLDLLFPCTLCSGKDTQFDLESIELVTIVKAMFLGECHECQSPIVPGQEIASHPKMGWIHASHA